MATAVRKDALIPAPHLTEFRRRTVELAREGARPVAKVAKVLDISESCLRNWMAQADADENGSRVPLAIPEKKELTELHRKDRQHEMGNGILKQRATAYVAWESILPK